MKKNKFYILGFIFSLVSVSCSEDILDAENKNAISQSTYYTTVDHAHQAVVAGYDAMKGNGLYGLRLIFLFMAMDDQGVYEDAVYEELIFPAEDEFVKFIYGYAYRGIAKSNLAMDKIPQIRDPLLTEELSERLIAEMKFTRSLYNFILHTTFNEPPLINEVILDMQAVFENATWPQFLEQIEKDLIGYNDEKGNHIAGAIDILPEEYDDSNIGRATKGAALTLMAKTYLYHEKWVKAKEYCQKVIDLGVYDLSKPLVNDSADYINAYQCNFTSMDLSNNGRTYKAENNIESIFSIQYANTDFVRTYYLPGWMCDGGLLYNYISINGWGNISCSVEYADEFEETPNHPAGLKYDPRKYCTIYSPGDTVTNNKESTYYVPFNPDRHLEPAVNTGFGIKKYLYPMHEEEPAPWNSPNDWRVYRYSDVLLMLAEAEYHVNGSTTLALNAINQVRERAGLEALTVLTPMDIVHERSCEFGFEGTWYFDLVRWGKIGDDWPKPSDYIKYFVEGKNEYLPIPTSEISKMQGKLKQNPGW